MSTESVGAGHPTTRLPSWLLVLAVVALAANLRIAVNVIGPLLPAIRSELALSGLQTGVLTAMPPFAFAVFGGLGPALARRVGPGRTVVVGLLLVAAGQLVRAVVPGEAALYLGTAIALAAIAVVNVLMPLIVTRFFPGRVGPMTAAYTVALAAFGALSSAGTLPVQKALGGSWHLGIGMWTAFAVLAVLPWLFVAGRDRAPVAARGEATFSLAQVARSANAWVLAIFFGFQSLQAYVLFSWYPTILSDHGIELTHASYFVGLISLASMVGSMLVPTLLGRMARPAVMVHILTACLLGGYLGTLLAAAAAPWVWSILLGAGMSFFPLGLYVVALRGRTHPGVLALSGFMQGLGYLLAGTGLMVFGTLQGHSTNWTPALLSLIVLTLLQSVAAMFSVRPWSIEDDIG